MKITCNHRYRHKSNIYLCSSSSFPLFKEMFPRGAPPLFLYPASGFSLLLPNMVALSVVFCFLLPNMGLCPWFFPSCCLTWGFVHCFSPHVAEHGALFVVFPLMLRNMAVLFPVFPLLHICLKAWLSVFSAPPRTGDGYRF